MHEGRVSEECLEHDDAGDRCRNERVAHESADREARFQEKPAVHEVKDLAEDHGIYRRGAGKFHRCPMVSQPIKGAKGKQHRSSTEMKAIRQMPNRFSKVDWPPVAAGIMTSRSCGSKDMASARVTEVTVDPEDLRRGYRKHETQKIAARIVRACRRWWEA